MIIKGADILTPGGMIQSGILMIKDGVIARISPFGDGELEAEPPHEHSPLDEVIDGTGLTLVPGFIDIHSHGGGGCDTLDGTYDSEERMCLSHAAHGTTGILPTTMAAPFETLLQVSGLIGDIVETKTLGGAGILGLHLEGPWLNPKFKGAQPITGIREPSIEELDELIKASSGNIRMITVAPEMPGALNLIKHAADSGIKVSLGHSSATYDQVIQAVQAGATHVTHAYNAMSGLHHRHPGMVGAMLSCDKLTADVILDGFHVHSAAAKILMKCKGKARLALITDATMAAGMPDGEYELGGQKVICRDGAVRLPDGNLAGSALTLDNAVKYAVRELGCSLEDAITMVSETPARIIGMYDKKGSVEEGKDADLVLLDSSLDVKATIVRGDVVCEPFRAEDRCESLLT
jgi:N-acetylglucosamine-6-phosphate deacetylase